MKKNILLSLVLIFTIFLAGCGKFDSDKELNKFVNKINKLNSYYLKGTMEISNNEDIYNYKIDAAYKKGNYKISLINTTNDHEQIILKNSDGVYVVTPSLNKSFKFQSEWPDNSSQAYVLSSLAKDIKSDTNKIIEETKNNYIVKVKVNYPNNPSLVYEKIYFDKDMDLKMVEVYDENDLVKMKVVFDKIDYQAIIKDEIFELETYIDEECCEESSGSGLIDNIIYPLYIPDETYLKEKETINTDTGERVILTFAGLKNFIIVEETIDVSDEFEIIPVYGEPLLLNESYGAISANSLTWHSSDVSYYLSSKDLTTKEMLEIATSLNSSTITVGK